MGAAAGHEVCTPSRVMIQKDDIQNLNQILRGELSAVETYQQAMEKLSDEPSVLRILRDGHQSHARRATRLQSEIRKLGGDPAQDSGVWGTFAEAVEGGAKMFGKKAAISALEEGEDSGLNQYRTRLNELSGTVESWVKADLLPEQIRTHEALSRLQNEV